ncbi:MAG: GNAT family N-acetyltransferase [SAR202 cluster bacterium]|nr:GNAT family N-acetyltransferase [SAR202 cluster bacterium]
MSSDDLGSLRKNGHITIREMEIGDLAPVYHLGERLFTRDNFPVLYRTWDPFEVTDYFNSDPEYCLVAVDSVNQVVAFALGSIVEKDGSPWKYGYLAWLGVAPEHQGNGVADRLLREFEKQMKEDGARILLVDTEADNHRAIRFFNRNGFNNPKGHVWLSKSLAKSQQNGHTAAKPVGAVYRTRMRQKASAKRPGHSGTVPVVAAAELP